MRITALRTYRRQAGNRAWSFCKLETDAGLEGWSEFSDDQFGSHGLKGAVHALGAGIVGLDPRRTRHVEALLHERIREAPGGQNLRAVAVLLNACLDLHARSLDVPVYALLGGPVRDDIPVYWSHCGLTRIRMAESGLGEAIRTPDDLEALGREVRDRGYHALKTNLLGFGPDGAYIRTTAAPGSLGDPFERRAVLRDVAAVIGALRRGAGPDVGIFLDINYNIREPALLQELADVAAEAGLDWLELDTKTPDLLRRLRAPSGLRIASCETLHGVEEFRPFLQGRLVDVPIIDPVWNGMPESVRMADEAARYRADIVTHNYASHLMSFMAAHLAAVAPNLSIMELDVEGVPWRDDVTDTAPQVVDGRMQLPTGPGWGCVPQQAALDADEQVTR
ncbi:mandelate racemase/muconate lactonizing enzyme family protein [Egicoccus halophilus]|uniref:glucarate dehydratase n=1 Tax=Egicoccus halophilus TaxID=1670830 RepID=A0A8J3ACI5_9ACTN|nr:mandelate racemase/muconate lactonizing enzyme family protein [Egicoccus halophilus]GGI08687.1 enolase [Egicoccus halophilus]